MMEGLGSVSSSSKLVQAFSWLCTDLRNGKRDITDRDRERICVCMRVRDRDREN
jgi:hypothetical protein